MKAIAAAVIGATLTLAGSSATGAPAHGPITGCDAYRIGGTPGNPIGDSVIQPWTSDGTARFVNLTPQRAAHTFTYASFEQTRPPLNPDAYKPHRIDGCRIVWDADGHRALVLITRSAAMWTLTEPRLRG